MKKILLPGLLAGVVLFILSYIVLYVTINFFPTIVESYYDPIFWPGNERAVLFFAHPFVLSFALAWFWDRFKSMFNGNILIRGIEMGLLYGIIATLPSMWITFSAISVSILMVLTWFLYGILQATVAGLIFAKMNP